VRSGSIYKVFLNPCFISQHIWQLIFSSPDDYGCRRITLSGKSVHWFLVLKNRINKTTNKAKEKENRRINQEKVFPPVSTRYYDFFLLVLQKLWHLSGYPLWHLTLWLCSVVQQIRTFGKMSCLSASFQQ